MPSLAPASSSSRSGCSQPEKPRLLLHGLWEPAGSPAPVCCSSSVLPNHTQPFFVLRGSSPRLMPCPLVSLLTLSSVPRAPRGPRKCAVKSPPPLLLHRVACGLLPACCSQGSRAPHSTPASASASSRSPALFVGKAALLFARARAPLPPSLACRASFFPALASRRFARPSRLHPFHMCDIVPLLSQSLPPRVTLSTTLRGCPAPESKARSLPPFGTPSPWHCPPLAGATTPPHIHIQPPSRPPPQNYPHHHHPLYLLLSCLPTFPVRLLYTALCPPNRTGFQAAPPPLSARAPDTPRRVPLDSPQVEQQLCPPPKQSPSPLSFFVVRSLICADPPFVTILPFSLHVAGCAAAAAASGSPRHVRGSARARGAHAASRRSEASGPRCSSRLPQPMALRHRRAHSSRSILDRYSQGQPARVAMAQGKSGGCAAAAAAAAVPAVPLLCLHHSRANLLVPRRHSPNFYPYGRSQSR